MAHHEMSRGKHPVISAQKDLRGQKSALNYNNLANAPKSFGQESNEANK